MLYELAAARSTRHVLWLYATRHREQHPFAAEVRRLVLALTHGRSYICYSRPGPRDKMGEDFDATGHLSRSIFDDVGVSGEADVYLCGPNRFVADMKEALATLGVAPERIHGEIFHGSESMTPGVVCAATRTPHLPEDDANTGPVVSFARSGITAHWTASSYQNILELAEACDVPVRGRAVPVFVITVRAVWFRGQSSTDRSHSKSPQTATFSFAAHSPFAMSSSICEV